jgi:galactitol-specific phosphotransferase system IIC component
MVFFHRNGNLLLKLISIIAVISLAAFISAMLINLHLHIALSGQIYIHSHPFEEGTQSGRHSHTQSDYTFLNILKNIGLKLLVIILVLAAILQIHRRSVSREPEFDGSSDFSFSYSNRAPPILSVS